MRARFGAIAVLVVAGSGCDPSGLTEGCDGTPTAAVTGQIVSEVNGLPIKDVRVDMILQSGVGLSKANLTTFTRADGTFLLATGAADVGESIVSIVVTAPGASYTMP